MLNEITREIWLFPVSRSLWLSEEHICGFENEKADRESRSNNVDTE